MAENNNQNNQQDINQLLKVRREKLQTLQDADKDPFVITKYDQTHHTDEVRNLYEAHEANILAGRVAPSVDGLSEAEARDVLNQDYVRTAKAKGVSGFKVIFKHSLRNALIPVVTYVGPMVAYILTLYINDPTGSMFIPFVGMIETRIFFWVIGVAVIYCTTNAVNFTDGIDGLCGSVTLTAAISFIAIAALRNCLGISLLASALLGALIGYLIWNWHPAKVMMGDLGSMFLGGLIVAFAYAVDCPIIILLTGIIYVAEFGSDIIQIGYFKLTHGKRIFKMAPIHHHFEMCGWKEEKIVLTFAAVSAVMCVIAWLSIQGIVK